jgi:hypothetical protein
VRRQSERVPRSALITVWVCLTTLWGIRGEYSCFSGSGVQEWELWIRQMQLRQSPL